mgnify:FL=1
MKRLIGVLFALIVACVPMRIQAQEVSLSFEYTGQKIEVEDATKYYSTDFKLLDEAPSDCGIYIAITSSGPMYYEIKPKDVEVTVSYNKDWRFGDPEIEKYLCDYDGDYEFKLMINTNDEFEAENEYNGNYRFVFSPSKVTDVKVEKTRVTHPDVECVYNEEGTYIYSTIHGVEPIKLSDAGEYTVSFDLDEAYYESVPFKVTILPKTVQLKLVKQTKFVGEKDPVLENDDYILTREPGEEAGDYKLTVQSKSKNYSYELLSGDVFTILDRRENETLKKPYIKEEPKKQKEVKKPEEPKKDVEPKHEDKKQSKVPTGVLVNTSINFTLLSLSVAGIVFVRKRMN